MPPNPIESPVFDSCLFDFYHFLVYSSTLAMVISRPHPPNLLQFAKCYSASGCLALFEDFQVDLYHGNWSQGYKSRFRLGSKIKNSGVFSDSRNSYSTLESDPTGGIGFPKFVFSFEVLGIMQLVQKFPSECASHHFYEFWTPILA